MGNSSWGADRRWERDVEREPAHAPSNSRRFASPYAAPYRTETQRRAAQALRCGDPCSVCSAQNCTCDFGSDPNEPCPVDHELVKQDPYWAGLSWVGIQPDVDDEGKRADLELRNCTCGTTLARLAAK